MIVNTIVIPFFNKKPDGCKLREYLNSASHLVSRITFNEKVFEYNNCILIESVISVNELIVVVLAILVTDL